VAGLGILSRCLETQDERPRLRCGKGFDMAHGPGLRGLQGGAAELRGLAFAAAYSGAQELARFLRPRPLVVEDARDDAASGAQPPAFVAKGAFGASRQTAQPQRALAGVRGVGRDRLAAPDPPPQREERRGASIADETLLHSGQHRIVADLAHAEQLFDQLLDEAVRAFGLVAAHQELLAQVLRQRRLAACPVVHRVKQRGRGDQLRRLAVPLGRRPLKAQRRERWRKRVELLTGECRQIDAADGRRQRQHQLVRIRGAGQAHA